MLYPGEPMENMSFFYCNGIEFHLGGSVGLFCVEAKQMSVPHWCHICKRAQKEKYLREKISFNDR